MQKNYGERLLELVEHGDVVEICPISELQKHVIGNTYWCGEKQKWYRVVDIHTDEFNFFKYMMVEWEDGQLGNYNYPLDTRKDCQIELNEKIKKRFCILPLLHK